MCIESIKFLTVFIYIYTTYLRMYIYLYYLLRLNSVLIVLDYFLFTNIRGENSVLENKKERYLFCGNAFVNRFPPTREIVKVIRRFVFLYCFRRSSVSSALGKIYRLSTCSSSLLVARKCRVFPARECQTPSSQLASCSVELWFNSHSVSSFLCSVLYYIWFRSWHLPINQFTFSS